MENASFENVWQLLSPIGEFCRRRRACERLWNSFSIAKQQAVFRILQAKRNNGEYINLNPYFAIDDNAHPVFLDGLEQERTYAAGIPLVLVKYQGRFLVCTREMMTIYHLEFVRNFHLKNN